MASYTNPAAPIMTLNPGDVIIFNAGGVTHNTTLPPGRYRILLGGADGGEAGDVLMPDDSRVKGGLGGRGGGIGCETSLSVTTAIRCVLGAYPGKSPSPVQALQGLGAGKGAPISQLYVQDVLVGIAGGGGGGNILANGSRPPYGSVTTWGTGTAGGDSSGGNTAGTSWAMNEQWKAYGPSNQTGISPYASLVITYLSVLNEIPTTPSSLTAFPLPAVGSPVTVSWNPAYDPDGDTITYAVQRRYTTIASPGAWTDWSGIYTGTDVSCPDSIAEDWDKVQWRVSATDVHGASAGWVEGTQYTVDKNHAPTVSGADGDLGVKNGAFTYDFSVNDVDAGDALTAIVTLDGIEIQRVVNAVRGQTYTTEITTLRWAMSAHGSHELKVTAVDDKGGMGVRRMTWSRTVMGVDVICGPVDGEIADRPERITLTPLTTLTPDATLTVLACNNAFDAAPTWEDMTASVVNRNVYLFANTSKTAATWGIKIRVQIRKGAIPGLVELRDIGGKYK